jgi:DNA-binding MarR family transcriptional regulator
MLTKKQLLILFLISSEPGIKEIYTLVKIFDRADFPANMKENLQPLLKNNLISVSAKFDNGTAKEYKITETGTNILKLDFDSLKIINYVKTLDEPKLLLDITQGYINKQNALNNPDPDCADMSHGR